MNDNHEIYKFGNERVRMPRPLAKQIEALLVQKKISDKMEKIYEVIRRNVPSYRHKDNSNARKMLTARNINGIIRKLPTTAIMEIVNILGIASGKYMQGSQPSLFDSIVSEISVEMNSKKVKKKGISTAEKVEKKPRKRKQLTLFENDNNRP